MNYSTYTIDLPYDALAENLVNSHDVSLAEPEHFRTVQDLRSFMAHHGLTPGTALTSQDLHRARRLRAVVRDVFTSRDAAQARRRINALLAGKLYTADVSAHGAATVLGWKVPERDDGIARLKAAAALNLAALLQTVGFDRCRVCEAAPCQDVFVDLSKKGNRIFCGPRCATRVHVARFRERERR
jgi:predicted RNA-binding Zn ribbon-like protein